MEAKGARAEISTSGQRQLLNVCVNKYPPKKLEALVVRLRIATIVDMTAASAPFGQTSEAIP